MNKSIIKKAVLILVCGAVFFFASYTYLNSNLNKNLQSADQKDYTVPYRQTPQNACVGFVFPSENVYLVQLDFQNEDIKFVTVSNFDFKKREYFGYKTDYLLECDYNWLAELIDCIGGINLETEGENLRYTGVQVVDLISTGHLEAIKDKLFTEIFLQISKNGILKDDFVFLLENCKGDLSLVDAIYWLDCLKEMCQHVTFVN